MTLRTEIYTKKEKKNRGRHTLIEIFLVFLSPSMNISRIEPQIQLPLPFTCY